MIDMVGWKQFKWKEGKSKQEEEGSERHNVGEKSEENSCDHNDIPWTFRPSLDAVGREIKFAISIFFL